MNDISWLGSFGFLGGNRGAQDYWQKVASTQSANLIGYWRMNETSGTVATDSSSQSNNGVYSGTALALANAAGPDNVLCTYFGGTAAMLDVYSAALNADFNGQEGTFASWAKVSAATDWIDGLFHTICIFLVDAQNYITLNKLSTSNTLQFFYRGGNVTEITLTTAEGGNTSWMHIAMTWSKAADEVKCYIDGLQVGTTATSLGTWAGNLASNRAHIGANITTPTEVWKGWLSHAALWNTPLTPAQIASIANPT